MADRRRLERVGQQVRAELSALIESSLDDPRIGMVTVTEVRMSKDMRHARVYVSGLGSATDRIATIAGLDSARSFLRSQLSARIPRLMRTPELTFQYDESVETGMRVEALLTEIARTEPSSEREDLDPETE